MGQLDGKLAVVTGAAGGIGLAIARRFLTEGAHVVITDIREKELDAAAVELGDNATAVACDISKVTELDRLYAGIGDTGRKIDILVANAAAAGAAPLAEMPEEMFDLISNVNFRGTFFSVQRALPLLQDGGSIVLLGSVASVGGYANIGVYSAVKAAIRALARNFVVELSARGIRVNTLSPGPTATEMLEEYPGGPENLPPVPLGRLARPEEIAAAALFLASEESSYVTGIELFVDGGLGQI